jgi:hypothetical protein
MLRNQNVLKHFMYNQCSYNYDEYSQCYTKLDDYLKENGKISSEFGVNDIMKFCQATLLFSRSSQAKFELDSLMAVHFLCQDMTDLMLFHFDESKLNLIHLYEKKLQVT